MAHTLQDRYSDLIDKKLQATLVTKDNYILRSTVAMAVLVALMVSLISMLSFLSLDYLQNYGITADSNIMRWSELSSHP